jgi:hypothetical protein
MRLSSKSRRRTSLQAMEVGKECIALDGSTWARRLRFTDMHAMDWQLWPKRLDAKMRGLAALFRALTWQLVYAVFAHTRFGCLLSTLSWTPLRRSLGHVYSIHIVFTFCARERWPSRRQAYSQHMLGKAPDTFVRQRSAFSWPRALRERDHLYTPGAIKGHLKRDSVEGQEDGNFFAELVNFKSQRHSRRSQYLSARSLAQFDPTINAVWHQEGRNQRHDWSDQSSGNFLRSQQIAPVANKQIPRE